MTRQEASKILRSEILDPYTGEYSDEQEFEAYKMAIKALEQDSCETIKEIPKDYRYDTETEDFLVYRHKYTGHEIHIEKPVPRYRAEQEPILDTIRAEIEGIEINGYIRDVECFRAGINVALDIINKYTAENTSNCNSCEHQNEVDGSNCYECVKGIRNNYEAESEE